MASVLLHARLDGTSATAPHHAGNCNSSPARQTLDASSATYCCTLSRQLNQFSCTLDTRRQQIRQLHTGTSQQLTSDPLQSVHSKLEHQALSNNRLVFYLTVTGLQHYYSCFLKSGSKIQQKSSTNYLLSRCINRVFYICYYFTYCIL